MKQPSASTLSLANLIVKFTALHFNVAPERVYSKDQHKAVADARHIACYFIYNEMKLNRCQVGRLLNRDHSTVLQSIRKVENLLSAKDPEITGAYNDIKTNLFTT